MSDNVNKPSHYILPDGTETLSVSRHLSSNGGQAVQYIVRATRTDGVVKDNPAEDVRKAIRLLQDEAERFEFLEGKGQANPDAVHKVIGDLNEMAAAYARDTAVPPSVYPASSPRVWDYVTDIPEGTCFESPRHSTTFYKRDDRVSHAPDGGSGREYAYPAWRQLEGPFVEVPW